MRESFITTVNGTRGTQTSPTLENAGFHRDGLWLHGFSDSTLPHAKHKLHQPNASRCGTVPVQSLLARAEPTQPLCKNWQISQQTKANTFVERTAQAPVPIPSAASFPNTEPDTKPNSPTQPVQGPVLLQRRSGTLTNYTPHDFEKSSFRRTNKRPIREVQENTIDAKPTAAERIGAHREHNMSSGGTGSLRKPTHCSAGQSSACRAISSTTSANHWSLEPLIAQHHPAVTGSDVDTRRPYVDVESLGEASASFAVQEYYKCLQPSGAGTDVGESREADRIVSGLSLPERNPSQLVCPATPRHARAGSGQSDFISAANGQYSPYDSQYSPPQTLHYGQNVTKLEDQQPLLLAPPIPSHDELTAARQLDEFNDFLRNTGPKEKEQKEQKDKKTKKGLFFSKPRDQTSLAARFGTVESGLNKPAQTRFSLPPRPTCTQEMTTSSGKKHLQIVIPETEEEEESRSFFDLPSGKPLRIHKRTSITFAEERILKPTGRSSGAERAISGSNSTSDTIFDGSPPQGTITVISGPNGPPVTSRSTPLFTKPLLKKREEQTRERKLRDLSTEKGKMRDLTVEKNNRVSSLWRSSTVSGAPQNRRVSCQESVDKSLEESMQGEDKVGNGTKEDVIRLEKLVQDLTMELAKAIGLNHASTILGPEYVLHLAREHEGKAHRED